MRIKHQDLPINKDNPFKSCQLNREQYADILTDLINSYSNGFVLAVNNQWGTGKTTFIKMWQQKLLTDQFKTIYFNAWENDFENDALVALMSELNKIRNDKTQKIFKELLSKANILSKKVLPAVLKEIIEKYVGKETLKEILGGLPEGISDTFSAEIEQYTNKQKGMKDFKEKLSEFISKTSSKKPIIFFIDELDRCRPDYAVNVLEKIKHFFSVPGIVFVLSIDKTQLGHAICGFYGSDNINSDEYLRRFIDVEYNIPEPDINNFINYLVDYFDLNDFFNHKERQRHELIHEKDHFVETLKMLTQKYNLNLRQIEKIFAQSSIAIKTFENNNYLFPDILLLFISLKLFFSDLYLKIKNKLLEPDELIDILNQKFDLSKHSEYMIAFLYYNYKFHLNNEINSFIANYYPINEGRINKADIHGTPGAAKNIWDSLLMQGFIDKNGSALNKVNVVNSIDLGHNSESNVLELLKKVYADTEGARKYMQHLGNKHGYLKLSYVFDKIELIDKFK